MFRINEGFIKNVFKKAKDFVKTKYKEIKKNAKKIIKSLKQTTGVKKTKDIINPGTLVAFQYDAKHKQNVYDRNPLIISLGPSKNHKGLFLGLNIHWMPLSERISVSQFFLDLLEKRNGKLTYDDVKPFIKKYQKRKQPILRSYYYNRVSNRVYKMDKEQYLTAAALPSEKWVGGR
jgi:hypothetical protein